MEIAREVVNNVLIEHVFLHAVNEEVYVYELEPVAELPRDDGVAPQQRNIMQAPMEREVSEHGHSLRLLPHLMHDDSGFTASVTTLHRTSLDQ
jgi:hypothetical protein